MIENATLDTYGGFTKEDFSSGKITDGEAASFFMSSGMDEDDTVTDYETGKAYTRSDLVARGNEELALRLYQQLFDSFQNILTNKDALVSAEQTAAIAGRSADEVRAAGESEEL